MKQYTKLFSLIVLSSTAMLLNADCGSSPYIQWRSEGRDTPRKLYGETNFAIYQDDMDSNYGTFAVTVQYDQTFRGGRLAECLFGELANNPSPNTNTSSNNNCCSNDCDDKVILVQGLQVENRSKSAWMAENFYLSPDFNSVITFSPKVSNILADFQLYVGLDRWVKGLYFRLYGPVVRNKSGLRPCENVISAGTDGYEQGFFDPNENVEQSELFQEALNFFGGCQLPAYDDQTVTVQPLKFAKFGGCNLNNNNTNNNNNNCCDNDCDNDCSSGSRHKTGFAELRGEFGWNYLQEKYRLMINLQAAAPTGTRPHAEWALEPMVGNGKHWELGIGLGGAWRMWQSEDEEKSFNFVVEADITHLFNAKQIRTFDLMTSTGVAMPNSRYMLAEQMGVNGEQENGDVPSPALNNFNPADSGFQFSDVYAPVANITTRKVKVSIGVQGDVVAMFNYNCRGFSWDLGYNFWGMSREEIKCSDDCPDTCSDECSNLMPFTENTWALKGDSSVAGFITVGTGDVTVNLSASESKATINSGTFTGTGFNDNNNNIDAAAGATAGNPSQPVLSNGLSEQINTSVPPVFISLSNFDFESAETRGYSNKVFTHFSYTWTKNDRWLPYLGAGFFAQFGSHCGGDDDCNPNPTTTNNCDDHHGANCALTNWAVFVKGGVSFH